MKRTMLLAAAAIVATPLSSVAGAQWNTVPAGVRVQVIVDNQSASANSGRTSLVQGLLIRSGDTLVISPSTPSASVLIPASSVKNLAISTGIPSRRRSTVMGLVQGTVAGAILSVPLMSALKGKGVSNRDAFLASTYIGASFGAYNGWTKLREQWDWQPRR